MRSGCRLGSLALVVTALALLGCPSVSPKADVGAQAKSNPAPEPPQTPAVASPTLAPDADPTPTPADPQLGRCVPYVDNCGCVSACAVLGPARPDGAREATRVGGQLESGELARWCFDAAASGRPADQALPEQTGCMDVFQAEARCAGGCQSHASFLRCREVDGACAAPE